MPGEGSSGDGNGDGDDCSFTNGPEFIVEYLYSDCDHSFIVARPTSSWDATAKVFFCAVFVFSSSLFFFRCICLLLCPCVLLCYLPVLPGFRSSPFQKLAAEQRMRGCLCLSQFLVF